jgi:hypothetical protein
MKRQGVLAGTVGAFVLGGLLMAGCGGGDESAVAQNAGVIDLSGVTPNWNKNLPAAQRFAILTAFNSAAVLDQETGLVWEQSPQTAAGWNAARVDCANKIVGNRKGWRLPSVHELASLIDPTQSSPALPLGHPFTNVVPTLYWSATTDAVSPGGAQVVNFGGGNVSTFSKAFASLAWCVRGGMNADEY